MDESQKEKLIIIIWIGVVILLIGIIVLYPMMNTHEEELKIIAIEVWGDGLYHIQTEQTVILHVANYYYDVLIPGRTYLIKWVDGVRVDRIISWTEVRSS